MAHGKVPKSLLFEKDWFRKTEGRSYNLHRKLY